VLENRLVIATLTLVADTLTPVRAYAALRHAAEDDASFLLESVVGGERWGRYSILGYKPRRELTLQANGEWVGARGLPHDLHGARDGRSRG
jgi:anthranilate synthase component 1